MKQKRSISRFWLFHPLVVTALLCLSFSGCGNNEEDEPPVPLRTILFYLGGDNNLSGEIDQKTEQLKKVSVPASCRLITYSDCRNTTPSLQEVGNGTLSVIREYPESNSADAEVFNAVLREVMELYPASSYGLVLFSHASGWMPEGTYSNPALRSVVIDHGAEMDIPDFAAAIPDNMLDFIIFEACHMAGIEVAYELKDKTKQIVVSSAEIVSPGFAPVYDEALPHLFKQEADLTGFCRAVEADYKGRESNYDSFSLSLVHTTGLDGIGTVLRGAALSSYIDEVQCFDRYGGRLFFDLSDAYSKAYPAKQAELQTAIDACVAWKSASKEFMPGYGGFDIKTHSGLTCYVPQENYPRLNEAYKKLRWYREILHSEIYATNNPF